MRCCGRCCHSGYWVFWSDSSFPATAHRWDSARRWFIRGLRILQGFRIRGRCGLAGCVGWRLWLSRCGDHRWAGRRRRWIFRICLWAGVTLQLDRRGCRGQWDPAWRGSGSNAWNGRGRTGCPEAGRSLFSGSCSCFSWAGLAFRNKSRIFGIIGCNRNRLARCSLLPATQNCWTSSEGSRRRWDGSTVRGYECLLVRCPCWCASSCGCSGDRWDPGRSSSRCLCPPESWPALNSVHQMSSWDRSSPTKATQHWLSLSS